MTRRRSIAGSVAASAVILAALVWTVTESPRAVSAAATPAFLPSANPANFTPNVLDGEVDSIWQVGGSIIVGGTFAEVADATTNGGTVYDRDGLAAFSATTGLVDPDFSPTLNGSVNAVVPSADGASVYIGGTFGTVNGVTRAGVARISLVDGSTVTAFDAGTVNGTVRDLRLVGDQLLLAGAFTHIAGVSRSRLGSLDATTGAVTSFLDLAIGATPWNGGVATVTKMETTPDGSRMVVIGNFTELAGITRNQIAMIDLSADPATVSDWYTSFYSSTCASAFDTYMRDLDISADGSFMVATTTGAYYANRACDTNARFELAVEAAGIEPTWINVTGGDTSYAVEIHEGVAYVGGHMRWMNNPSQSGGPGQGAVEREGIAALDVVTGLPYSWNPGRDRGVGVFDFHVTPAGLWAGSDTQRWAGELRQRLAFFPWAGGTTVPASTINDLPGRVVQIGQTSGSTGSDPSVLHRVNAGGPQLASVDDGPDWAVDTNATPSPHRNTGSSATTYVNGPSVGTMTAAVPDDDLDRPSAGLWGTERWDPSGGNEMEWNFPVASGTPVEVRLYVGNKSLNTDEPGDRIFAVSVDGVSVAPLVNLSADPGHNVGTMLAVEIVADANGVDIDFAHGTDNNPLVNGIEIVRTDMSGVGTFGDADRIRHIAYDGAGAPIAAAPVAGSLPWHVARGAFLVGGTLHTVHADGTIVVRSYDGTTFGAGDVIDTHANTFLAEAATITGLVYDPQTSRIFYTRAGNANLFHRRYLPESGIIGAYPDVHPGTTTAGPDVISGAALSGFDPTDVAGMFLASGSLWYADGTTGDLMRIGFAGGVLSGAPTVADTSIDWQARAMFVIPSDPTAPTTTSSTSTPTTTPGSPPTTTGTTGTTTVPGGTTAFTPVSPTRVFDTRGTSAGVLRDVPDQQVGGQNELRVRFSALAGATPDSGVGAVALNVAVTGPVADGFLTVYPCGTRELVASVNYLAGQTVSNLVIAPVSDAGELCFYSLVPTDIVVDINGWLPLGSSFTAVSPERVFDTRPGESPDALRDVTRVQVGPATPLEVSVADLPGVTPSSGIGAVSLNLAITNPASSGFVTVFPCGERKEVASANYTRGQTVSNAVIAPVSAAGTICFYSLAPTDIVVDINGWFAAGAGFVATGPERVLDTRPGQSPTALLDVERTKVSPSNVLRVKLTGLPNGTTPASGVSAVSLNVAVTDPDAAGFVTVYPCDTRREVANVNYVAGQTVPNAVVAPVSPDGEVCIYSHAAAHLVVDINGWFPAG